MENLSIERIMHFTSNRFGNKGYMHKEIVSFEFFKLYELFLALWIKFFSYDRNTHLITRVLPISIHNEKALFLQQIDVK